MLLQSWFWPHSIVQRLIRQEVNLSAINYCASFHCVSHHEMRLELPNEMNQTGINVMTESWSKFVPLFSLPILIPRLTESISCCSFICVERNEAKYCDSWEPFEQFQIIDRIIEYWIYDGISQVEWLLLGMTAQPSPDIRLRNEEEERKREPEIQRARKWMEMALNRLNEANVRWANVWRSHSSWFWPHWVFRESSYEGSEDSKKWRIKLVCHQLISVLISSKPFVLSDSSGCLNIEGSERITREESRSEVMWASVGLFRADESSHSTGNH